MTFPSHIFSLKQYTSFSSSPLDSLKRRKGFLYKQCIWRKSGRRHFARIVRNAGCKPFTVRIRHFVTIPQKAEGTGPALRCKKPFLRALRHYILTWNLSFVFKTNTTQLFY